MTPRTVAVILAAGTSSRMEGSQKLVEALAGEPILSRVAWAGLESKAESVTVVLGHDSALVREVVPDGVHILVNADYRSGLASSLRVGLASLEPATEAAVVLLGDMPFVRSDHIDALIDHWRPGTICVACHRSQRGNPVLWPSELFDEMMGLAGDRGARSLMAAHPEMVLEVQMDEAVTFDVDSPADLERARHLV